MTKCYITFDQTSQVFKLHANIHNYLKYSCDENLLPPNPQHKKCTLIGIASLNVLLLEVYTGNKVVLKDQNKAFCWMILI